MLLRDGEPLTIGPKIFDLLVLLVTNAGRAVDRLELVATLWGEDSHADGANVNQAIWLLRKVLGPQGAGLIETVPRKGYRFNGSLRAFPHDGPPVDIKSVDEISGGAEPVSVPEQGPVRLRRRVLVAGVAFAVALAGCVGWYLATRTGAAEEPGPPPRSHSLVAVVGFKNLSGAPETGWISTALAHMLTMELAGSETLRTVSIEDVTQARTELDLADAGSLSPDTLHHLRSLLGMDHVVVGTYLTMGSQEDDLRVDLRVQDARSGEIVLATSREAALSELSELVASLGDELRARLGPAGLSPAQS